MQEQNGKQTDENATEITAQAAKLGEAEPAKPAKMHAGRIIVRNLAFDMTAKHLRKEFQKYGTINDVNIPLKAESTLNRGFGFIEYSSKEEATAAITAMHQKKWKGRTLALEHSLASGIYASKVDKIVERTNLNREEAILPKILRQEKKQDEIKKEQMREQQEKEAE